MDNLILIITSIIALSSGNPSIISKNDIPKKEAGLNKVIEIATMTSFIETDTVKISKTVLEEKDLEIPTHGEWNKLLEKYVTNKGNVNYKKFSGDIAALNGYLDQLAKMYPTENWSKDERMTYYINLYNAATVKLILDNYPVKSIKHIKSPWVKKRVLIGDKMFSLGNIEHQILRKMNDARIHFAINCASFSCPKLLNVAYTADKLEQQLQQVTLDFVNDPGRNQISSNNVQLSEIFKWYKSDFTNNGSLIEYVNQYAKSPILTSTKIEYLNYDWSLNEAK